jgi:hypothetical protein
MLNLPPEILQDVFVTVSDDSGLRLYNARGIKCIWLGYEPIKLLVTCQTIHGIIIGTALSPYLNARLDHHRATPYNLRLSKLRYLRRRIRSLSLRYVPDDVHPEYQTWPGLYRQLPNLNVCNITYSASSPDCFSSYSGPVARQVILGGHCLSGIQQFERTGVLNGLASVMVQSCHHKFQRLRPFGTVLHEFRCVRLPYLANLSKTFAKGNLRPGLIGDTLRIHIPASFDTLLAMVNVTWECNTGFIEEL